MTHRALATVAFTCALLSASAARGAGDAFGPFCDVTNASLWKMTTSDYHKDPGRFVRYGNVIESEPGSAWGVDWCNEPLPRDFVLRIEWLRKEDNDNSGVFIRFPNPDAAHEPNTALVAARGFEIQIDELGSPDGAPYHRTGAIYGERDQIFSLKPARPLNVWNTYEIEARGQHYVVSLNGTAVSRFDNHDPNRAKASSPNEPSYFGVQAERGHVQFRNVEIQALP
jgi:Domain of Unknown Function (DUF1080)